MRDILRKSPNSQDYWNFDACSDVYQALLSPHEREPGFEAKPEDIKPWPEESLGVSQPICVCLDYFAL